MKHLYTAALIAVMALLSSGCTTLRKQTDSVRISSKPQGADIYVGNKYLGKTPGFFNLIRARDKKITLKRKGYLTTDRNLSTSYRWGDSFFSNLVFVPLWWCGPLIGWSMDLWTQTAWDFDHTEPVILKVDGSDVEPEVERTRIIAISPPQTDFELLSDEMAERLETLERNNFSKDQILPVSKTRTTFDNYSYTSSEPVPTLYREHLYEELGATHILESKVSRDKETLIVNMKLVDVFTDEEIEVSPQVFQKSEFAMAQKGWFSQFAANTATSIIPNTLTVDIANPFISFALATDKSADPYKAYPEYSNTALSYLSAIGIRNLKSPKLIEHLHPLVRLSTYFAYMQNEFHFSRQTPPNPLQGYIFDWSSAVGGAGPELGLESAIGYFYLDFIPVYSFNWISGQGFGRDTSRTYSGLGLTAEGGYQFFITDRFNFRIFIRSTYVPTGPWADVASELSGQPIVISQAGQGAAGLSIGYYFPEARQWTKDILR